MMDEFEILARKQRTSNAIDLGLTVIKVSPKDQWKLIVEVEELQIQMRAAANTYARLTDENEELRAALREIAGLDGGTILTHVKLAKAKEIARAALGEKTT